LQPASVWSGLFCAGVIDRPLSKFHRPRTPGVIVLPHGSFNRHRRIAPPRNDRAVAFIARHVAASRHQERVLNVKFQIVFAVGVVAASLVSPLAAQAQGIPDGVAHGAYVGNNAAGPVGAVVGGAVGGVIGGINGVLGIGPTYAAYPAEGPHVYRHRIRHSYRHAQRPHTTG
jgi:hypothetical protein